MSVNEFQDNKKNNLSLRENSQNFRGNPDPNGYNPHPNPLPRRGNKCAFTLAEVLITLVIIGVIAAITVPTIIVKIRSKRLESAYLKSFSSVSQALQKMRADEGDLWETYANYSGLGNSYNRNFGNNLLKYLQESKITGRTEGYVKSYNNEPNASYLSGLKRINGAFDITTQVNAWRIYIIIDTNTFAKGPNRLGYDIFRFAITRTSNGKMEPLSGGGIYCGTETIDCSYFVFKNISPNDSNLTYWEGLY